MAPAENNVCYGNGGYIREQTPFDNWKEFLVAAFEAQAAPDEIRAPEDATWHAASQKKDNEEPVAGRSVRLQA